MKKVNFFEKHVGPRFVNVKRRHGYAWGSSGFCRVGKEKKAAFVAALKDKSKPQALFMKDTAKAGKNT